MNVKDRIALLKRRLGMAGTRIDADWLPLGEAERFRPRSTSDLGRMFFDHKGRIAHKWADNLDIYDRYFAPFRNSDVIMLEIGVSLGGSLELWRRYFGDKATIFGIDIDPACASRFDRPNQVRIGSQADPVFLRSVVKEMGAPDIILDDGSHVANHQMASFRTLWPLLKPGGLYAIEDMHTAYWPGEFEGGFRRPGTAIEMVKQILDDMHGWYHEKPTDLVARDEVVGIHAHESIVFIEKAPKERPVSLQVGTASTT